MKYSTISFLFLVVITVMSCKNRPKVISSDSSESSGVESGIFSDHSGKIGSSESKATWGEDMHIVVVKEILPASRYVYLKVTEGNSAPFWIAAVKKDVKIGDTYYYKGGLLKTNFESKDHTRTFDTIYLINRLINHNHSASKGLTNTTKEDIPTHTNKVVPHKGSITIAELVSDPKKYEGSTVQISGNCVKINANIMDRNWIHIKDGSKDDYDLVVTSSEYITEGSQVTMKALVVLNKDFGAGYSYELILENGVVQ